MKKLMTIAISTVLLAALGCGPDSKKGGGGDQPADCSKLSDTGAQAACRDYPSMLDMHVGLMQAVCSPNPNVCHQTNSYPDMHTAGNLLSLVGEPCNVELPDPTQGWDSCELPADKISSGVIQSDIAWIEKDSPGNWRVGLRTAAPGSGGVQFQILDAAGGIVLQSPAEFQVILGLTAGSTEAVIQIGSADTFVIDFVDSVLATVVGGDANRNGIWGGSDPNVQPGALVWAGDPSRSYLWGRVTGKVPGTRMPLANGPVTNPQYIALACWIEGLSDDPTVNAATDYIDYESCSFAQNPEDLEITDY